MKKIISWVLLLGLVSVHMNGQVRHEIKLNPLAALFNRVQLSYEVMPHPNIGIELDVRYIFGTVSFIDTTSTGGIFGLPDALVFDQDRWEFLLSGKYYFNPDSIGNNKWYAGLFLYKEIHSRSEEGLQEAYQRLYNRSFPKVQYEEIEFGVSLGYKFLLLKGRLSIEPVWSYVIDVFKDSRLKGLGLQFELEAKPMLKVGYRF